jgi:hypothetical protein
MSAYDTPKTLALVLTYKSLLMLADLLQDDQKFKHITGFAVVDSAFRLAVGC